MDQNWQTSSLDDLRLDAYAELLLPQVEERERLENDLKLFVQQAWPIVDSSEYSPHWSIDALCDHLQAMSDGDIRRLLANYPPRCGKTNVLSIIYPAWVWCRSKISVTSGPGVRFLSGSYDAKLSLRNAVLSRRLILSEWYQSRWGDRFSLRDDQNTKGQFDNDKGGVRFSTSVGGSLLGVGYDIGLIDDPHSLAGIESDAERATTRDWMQEILTTRMNDPKKSVLAVVMQRLAQDDTSGNIKESPDYKSWTHVLFPMEYRKAKHCVTVLKRDAKGKPVKAWMDPRTVEGQLMWPERFGSEELERMKRELGPYMASGRLQQDPEPVGGGIIKRGWWKLWGAAYPTFSFILGVVDTAYTEKTQNDPSAMTIWGVFADPVKKVSRVMLIYAWEGHKELPELVDIVESISNVAAKKTNGHADISSFPIDHLVIEDKASGKSVAQQLHKLYGNMNRFSVELVTPDKWGDKIARVYAVQHLFADGMIYAGAKKEGEAIVPRNFAKMVIDQMAVFPYSTNKDLTDTASMALLYLRQTGHLERRDEYAAREIDETTYRKQPEPLYEFN